MLKNRCDIFLTVLTVAIQSMAIAKSASTASPPVYFYPKVNQLGYFPSVAITGDNCVLCDKKDDC